jgi:hypothetical protein
LIISPHSTYAAKDVLLTGLPRSGTTLICWLLNKLPNVVALHEPLQLRSHPETMSVPSILNEFIRETRAQLIREGTAPSHATQGSIESNPISTPTESGQSRIVVHSHQIVFFGKPKTADFQLAIKHNAPFTALIEGLCTIYPMGAIIRNPLALLCSWQTVPLPIREGRLPMAERYDKDLSKKLDSLKHALDRQLLILDWCFDKYRQLSDANIFRYEDIITTGGGTLSRLFPSAKGLKEELITRNRNTIYPLQSSARLAETLLNTSGSWRAFYTEQDIFSLT